MIRFKPKKKKSSENTLANSVFGVCFGFSLVLLSVVKILNTYDNTAYAWLALGVGGVSLISAVIIYPALCNPLRVFIQFAIKSVFKLVLTFVVGLMYVIIVLPIGVLSRGKRASKYGYYDSFNIPDGVASVFLDCDSDIELNKYKQYIGKNRIKSHTSRFLSFVSENRMFFIIPAALLLLFCAILFWFVSTGVAQYFIYTIF